MAIPSDDDWEELMRLGICGEDNWQITLVKFSRAINTLNDRLDKLESHQEQEVPNFFDDRPLGKDEG